MQFKTSVASFINSLSFSRWENIDAEADRLKAESLSETDFFLDIFLHEFAHAMHGGNIIKKLGFRAFENLMEAITTRQFYHNFQRQEERSDGFFRQL